ncbi:phosphatase PAP2 family protein [Lysobacter sp. TY2-98]|uniref:phosphatase PAP2 family protein n=1 Tax=Lysobacter sp. TY2-98 TaxID=2290922 RepID=UPI0013B3775D|nr:phosphatase PAP2 family protein [Lysobacter sp. TY2-98]
MEEGAELSAIVIGSFAAVSLFSQRHVRWARGFRHGWFLILLVIASIAVLTQVLEEVLGQESTAIDRAILEWIHGRVPAGALGFFNALTWTGSSRVVVPVASLLVVVALWRKQRFEALQVALTTALAGLVIYFAKTAVARPRPDLWSTQWFWGSSFPSGHTLISAALATSLCLWIARQWPRGRIAALVAGTTWVALVGLSRLVLGVHWPTDVVAAACAGLLVAAGVNGALALVAVRTRKPRSV